MSTRPVPVTRLPIRTPEAPYTILIGRGLLGALPDLLMEHGLDGRPIIVTNRTLAPLYGNALARRLGAQIVALPDGEQHKTLEMTRALYDAFIEAQIDRHGVVIALGGGVIGDLAGFAAATYLRGVALIQVPTSLLAMVDASVGGKVGVDLPQGKNLVGAFKQPVLVVADVDTLRTLPDIEWRCGLAEIVKAGLIGDPSLLDPRLYRREPPESVIALIRQSIAVKAAIVQEDPYEQGVRAHLNLGHTFGHALERVSGFTWKHGEAVAVGLLAAGRLSQVQGLCDPALPFQIEGLLRALGLPVRYRTFSGADLLAAMGTDKKRQRNRLRFVLLRGAGAPVISDDVPAAKVLSVLESLRE